MIRIILFSIVCLFLTSCEESILGPDFQYLSIYLDVENDNLVSYKDDNGYYHIEYEPNAVYYVKYESMPNDRVFWHSPDDFSVEWMGSNFEYPIINYSTYANDYGTGAQLYYLDNTMIGDTLSIFGYLDYTMYSGLVLIVEDNN